MVGWVPAAAIVAHRISWSMVLLVALVHFGRRWGAVMTALRTPRLRWWLCVTTLLLGTNWFVFIVAVATHRLVESSIGYFINPIFTVILGVIFLRERLRPAQVAAVILAIAGLVVLSVTRELASEGFPWICIVLPASFGTYGLIRKRLAVEPLAGVAVETAILTPPSVAYLAWFHSTSAVEGINAPSAWLLLSLSGIVTTLPIVWFVAAAKRLTLTTVGFLQFLNPTLQFLTAVLLFDEAFTRGEAISLGLIALGVAMDLATTARAQSRPAGSART